MAEEKIAHLLIAKSDGMVDPLPADLRVTFTPTYSNAGGDNIPDPAVATHIKLTPQVAGDIEFYSRALSRHTLNVMHAGIDQAKIEINNGQIPPLGLSGKRPSPHDATVMEYFGGKKSKSKKQLKSKKQKKIKSVRRR